MKKTYNFLNDYNDDDINDQSESVRYREYKTHIKNVQVNFEKTLSEFKESLDKYENDINKQKTDQEMNEFLSNNKKKLEELEKLHRDGVQNLDIMKNYFSHNNNTYAIEILRYCSIFDKFKIQLQNLKNIFDKICIHNNIINMYKKKESYTNFTTNNTITSNSNDNLNHVIKEKSVLEYALSELDNIIYVGKQTNFKLKIQNSNIMQQLKKINIINTHLPQIHKILKKIKHYNFKKTAILAFVIGLCIFIFFIFR
ncbi:conserved protein, unknown function [Hepatocystis sp. ex Piliocolobus tephrosceles]|nr:conserved protein, unknown function [Hepatocystis sp. ex Piliocolobus tephrosceles]